MSAQAFRHELRGLLMKDIEEFGTQLMTRFGDTESQMRLNQGIIEGLNIAIRRLDDAYRKLGS